jgi:hypothetical protein
VVSGAVGTGKSHMATAWGIRACDQGDTVRFFTVTDWVLRLRAARRAGPLERLQQDLQQAAVLVFDEGGLSLGAATGPSCWSGSSPTVTQPAAASWRRPSRARNGAASCPPIRWRRPWWTAWPTPAPGSSSTATVTACPTRS